MTKYYKGAENAPLKEVNTYCPIKVFLYDLRNDDDCVAEFELDYANVADRRRLGRISFWAVMNNHSVETMSKKDAEGQE